MVSNISLKLTVKAPENGPGPSYSNHPFSGEKTVSFREGNHPLGKVFLGANLLLVSGSRFKKIFFIFSTLGS